MSNPDWMSNGEQFKHSIRGEFYHLDNIQKILSTPTSGLIYQATLRLDNNNEHDDQAVAVLIDHLIVGHLSQANARRFRKKLGALNQHAAEFKTQAKILVKDQTPEIKIDIRLANEPSDDAPPAKINPQKPMHDTNKKSNNTNIIVVALIAVILIVVFLA